MFIAALLTVARTWKQPNMHMLKQHFEKEKKEKHTFQNSCPFGVKRMEREGDTSTAQGTIFSIV